MTPEQVNEAMAAVPVEHREAVARWLILRAQRYQPSFLLTKGQAAYIQDALCSAAVDVADPTAEDSTLAHAARVMDRLREGLDT